jgi:hypothetical protein
VPYYELFIAPVNLRKIRFSVEGFSSSHHRPFHPRSPKQIPPGKVQIKLKYQLITSKKEASILPILVLAQKKIWISMYSNEEIMN